MREPPEFLRRFFFKHPCLAGLCITIFGVWAFHYAVYSAYLDALAGIPSRVMVGTGSFMAPLVTLAGLFITIVFCFKKPKLVDWRKEKTPLPLRHKVLVILGTPIIWLILAAPYAAILNRITALGFHFERADPVYWAYTHIEVLRKLAEAVDKLIP